MRHRICKKTTGHRQVIRCINQPTNKETAQTLMNLYKKSVLALVCAISVSAYAADSKPSAPNTPSPSPVKKRSKCDCSAIQEKVVSSLGFDPASEQGQIMLRFVKRAMSSNSKLSERIQSFGETSMAEEKLSAAERLRTLALIRTMVTATPTDCKVYLDSMKEDASANFLSKMSPQALQAMLDAIEIRALHEPSDDETDTGGTIEEKLETHKYLRTAFKLDENGVRTPPPTQCEQIPLMIDHVLATPKPKQDRASLALLRALDLHPSAPRMVLRQPETYLNEAFDERVLPEAIRSSLPADGSRPLPFKRAVFDLEVISKRETTTSQRLTSTVINRRNNGVLAGFTVPTVPSGDVDWTELGLGYGLATLRSHFVESRINASQANQLEQAAVAAANTPLKEGMTLRIPLPQPDFRGDKERVCTVGSEKQASTVFAKFTGSAIDLHCKVTSSEGMVTELHSVWLHDLQMESVLSAENKYGRNEVVIRDVKFE